MSRNCLELQDRGCSRSGLRAVTDWARLMHQVPAVARPGRRAASQEDVMRFGMLHLFENPIGKTKHEIIHEQM